MCREAGWSAWFLSLGLACLKGPAGHVRWPLVVQKLCPAAPCEPVRTGRELRQEELRKPGPQDAGVALETPSASGGGRDGGAGLPPGFQLGFSPISEGGGVFSRKGCESICGCWCLRQGGMRNSISGSEFEMPVRPGGGGLGSWHRESGHRGRGDRVLSSAPSKGGPSPVPQLAGAA